MFFKKKSAIWSLAFGLELSLGIISLPACDFSPRMKTPFNVSALEGAPTSVTWSFILANSSQFTLSDTSKIDFKGASNSCELISPNQTDDTNYTSGTSGFYGGTNNGALSWDTTNHLLRLKSTASCVTNNTCAELDTSWTPKYANLTWYWKMNGSGAIAASVTPDVGTGTVTRWSVDPTYVTGQQSTGLQITDVANSGFNILNTAIPAISDKISIGGWIKATGAIGAWGVLTQFDDGTSGFTIQRWNNSNYFFFLLHTSAGSFNVGQTTMTLADGNWHHFVYTGGGGLMDAYLDGVKLDHTTYTPGTGGFSSTNTSGFVRGDFLSSGTVIYDDIGIWHEVLTANEVATIYNHQVSKFSGAFVSRVMGGQSGTTPWTSLSWLPTLPFSKEIPSSNELQTTYSGLVNSSGVSGNSSLATNLVALWHLDEATTGTAPGGKDSADSSGNPYHGVLGGTYSITSAGRFNRAINFGTNGYMNPPTTLNSNLGTDMTFSIFVKSADLCPGGTCAIAIDEDYGVSGFRLGLVTWGGSPQWQLWTDESGGNMEFRPAASIAVANQWVHLAFTYKRSTSTLRLYMNGKEVGNTTGTLVAPTTSGSSYFVIGSNGSGFNGLGDEIGMWSRALDPQEILQIYRRGANRVKFQVRTCGAADAGKVNCTDDAFGNNWRGPDGTNTTYYSELNNTLTYDKPSNTPTGVVNLTSPMMTFANFSTPTPAPNLYFQYRAILESDDPNTTGCTYDGGSTHTWCSPEIKSVSVGPTHYDSSSPTIITKVGLSAKVLSSFIETLGASCASGVAYSLGVGATSPSAWYYWNGSAWVTANGSVTQTNSAATISAHASSFTSTGTVFLKAFLKSDGSSKCELNQVQLNGLE